MQSLSLLLTTLRASSLRLATAVQQRVEGDLLSLRAMGLTYTTLLSLVPLLAVTFSVLKAFGVQNQLEPVLAETLEPLGPEGSEITNYIIQFVDNLKVGALGAVGVATLFYTVISLISKIEESLNHIWRARRSRSLGQKFRDYLSVVLVGPVLVFTALALTASAQSSAFVQQVSEIKSLGFVVIAATRIMPLIFLCGVFTFLYRFLPCTHVRFRSALVGGVVAGILWQLAGVGFAAFVANSARYAAIYSGFAILILFFIWLYVGWLIILIGGEVAYFHQYPNTYLKASASQDSTPFSQERLALAALVEITHRYLLGKTPWYTTELAAVLGVPLSRLEEVIEKLTQRGIVLRTVQPEGIVLGRPPEQITGIEIFDTLYGATPRDSVHNGEDLVGDFLRRRDQALQHALADVTLRSLASETPGEHQVSPAALPVEQI